MYLAQHLRLGTLWALKEINKSSSKHIDILTEANMMNRLIHPALPRVIDIYEDANYVYIVEDYVEGIGILCRLA